MPTWPKSAARSDEDCRTKRAKREARPTVVVTVTLPKCLNEALERVSILLGKSTAKTLSMAARVHGKMGESLPITSAETVRLKVRVPADMRHRFTDRGEVETRLARGLATLERRLVEEREIRGAKERSPAAQ